MSPPDSRRIGPSRPYLHAHVPRGCPLLTGSASPDFSRACFSPMAAVTVAHTCPAAPTRIIRLLQTLSLTSRPRPHPAPSLIPQAPPRPFRLPAFHFRKASRQPHLGPGRRRLPRRKGAGWGTPGRRFLGPPGRCQPRDSLRGDETTVRAALVPPRPATHAPSPHAHPEAPPPFRRRGRRPGRPEAVVAHFRFPAPALARAARNKSRRPSALRKRKLGARRAGRCF